MPWLVQGLPAVDEAKLRCKPGPVCLPSPCSSPPTPLPACLSGGLASVMAVRALCPGSGLQNMLSDAVVSASTNWHRRVFKGDSSVAQRGAVPHPRSHGTSGAQPRARAQADFWPLSSSPAALSFVSLSQSLIQGALGLPQMCQGPWTLAG